MPTLCSTRISKNLGQVSFFIIWDKMALDKLSSGASWNRTVFEAYFPIRFPFRDSTPTLTKKSLLVIFYDFHVRPTNPKSFS